MENEWMPLWHVKSSNDLTFDYFFVGMMKFVIYFGAGTRASDLFTLEQYFVHIWREQQSVSAHLIMAWSWLSYGLLWVREAHFMVTTCVCLRVRVCYVYSRKFATLFLPLNWLLLCILLRLTVFRNLILIKAETSTHIKWQRSNVTKLKQAFRFSAHIYIYVYKICGFSVNILTLQSRVLISSQWHIRLYDKSTKRERARESEWVNEKAE